MDFSFNNQDIKAYFEGDDSNPPYRELVYLHTHPLVQPNFLSEIDQMVKVAGERLSSKDVPSTSTYINKLESLCIELGQSIPELKVENPELTLAIFKDIYILCKDILK